MLGQNAESQNFAEFLLKLGEGEIEADELDRVQLPEEFFSTATSVEEFVKEIVSDNDMDRTLILAVKNDTVAKINKQVIRLIDPDQPIFTSKAVDTFSKDDSEKFDLPQEFLSKLNPSGMPPFELELKTNCVVMVLRNLFPSRGFCNGTRCKVRKIQDNYLILEVMDGPKKGKQTALPKIALKSKISNRSLLSFKRLQFPVSLSYATTINKAQGQSLDSVGVCLDEDTFTHGQPYVAASRTRNPKKLKIFSPSKPSITNIVYREVLE